MIAVIEEGKEKQTEGLALSGSSLGSADVPVLNVG